MLRVLRFNLLLIILLALTACSRPDFHLIDGTSISLSEHKGQWVIINYWAEWCKPCLEEVPELNHFYQQVGDELLFLSISYDKASNEELKRQQQKYQIQYPIIATLPAPKINIPIPSALPANYLIAPDGTTYGPVLGPQDANSLVDLIKKYETRWLSETGS